MACLQMVRAGPELEELVLQTCQHEGEHAVIAGTVPGVAVRYAMGFYAGKLAEREG